MPQDKTNTNSTKIYSSASENALKTASYGAQTDSRTDRTTAHNLGAGDTVQLAGGEYRIGSIISGEKKSGEAVIYLIRDNAGNDFALKLYYPFRDARDEPNSEALKRIKDIDNPDILKLHHFGTGAEKYREQFCYEISDYAKGGDLLKVENIKEKYTPEFIERHVIKEIFKGIQILHQNRIYHCDLKPQNVFYRDETQTDLVIGDYGSAKTFEQSSEKELSYMSVVKGTDFYLAPEQAIGIISEKNDYYSFGMIILHLLYPEKIDQQTLRKIYERRAAEKPIIDYDPKYKRLNDLIAGLTLQDIQQRWGQKEVSQWLAGKSVAVQYKKAAVDSVTPIKIGTTTIHTEEDLIYYVSEGKDWFRLLIGDEQGYGLLMTWVSQHQNLENKQKFDALMRIAAPKGVAFARDALLRYFRPERPVRVITDLDVFQADDPAAVTGQFIEQLEDQWKIAPLNEMALYIFCFLLSLKQRIESGDDKKEVCENILQKFTNVLNERGAEISKDNEPDQDDEQEIIFKFEFESEKKKRKQGKKQKHFIQKTRENLKTDKNDILSVEITDNKIIELFYAFNPERIFRDLSGKSYESLNDIGLFFASNPGLWNDRFLKEERRRFLKKIRHTELAGLNRDQFLFSVFHNEILYVIEVTRVNHNPEKDFIHFHCRIDRSLADFFKKHKIRDTLNAKQQSVTVTLNHVTNKSCETLYSEFLKILEKEHEIPRDKWTTDSLERLTKTIRDNKAVHAREANACKRRRIREETAMTVRSFLFLLPLALLYFVLIAYFENNFKLMNVLSALTPFDISFEYPFFAGDVVQTIGLFFITTLFIIPSCIYIFINTDAETGAKIGLGIFVVFLNYLIIGISFSFTFPLPAAILIIAGVTVWSYLVKANRVRFRPFLISALAILLMVFIGDRLFEDTLPSTKVDHSLNIYVELRASDYSDEDKIMLRSKPSDGGPIVGVAYHRHAVTVIAEEAGWYLVRHIEKEGYIPPQAVGKLDYLINKEPPPSAGVVYPLNIQATPKGNVCFVRAGTSEEHAVIGTLNTNDTVRVISRDGSWSLTHSRWGEGYVKTGEVNQIVMKTGRLTVRKPVVKKEPSFKSESLSVSVYGEFPILAEHNEWYLIRVPYEKYGYVLKKDVKIVK